MERLEKTRELASNQDYIYRVTLQSAWHDYGEQSGVGTGKTMEEAEIAAEENFRELNNRQNVEVSARFAAVVFPNGFVLTAPHEFRT